MAYFYGTTRGHKTAATRTGLKSSGIISTANSWTAGAEVHISHNSTLGKDIVTLYITKGSDSPTRRLISYYYDDNDELQIVDNNFPELLI